MPFANVFPKVMKPPFGESVAETEGMIDVS